MIIKSIFLLSFPCRPRDFLYPFLYLNVWNLPFIYTLVSVISIVNIFILLFFLIKIAIQQIHNFTRMLDNAVINLHDSFCTVECCLPFFHYVFILNQIITSEQFKEPFTNFFILFYLPQCNILRVKLSIKIFLMKINNFIIKIIIKFINIF